MLSRLLRAAGATLVALATLVAVPVASAATVSGVTVNQNIPNITRGVAYSHQVTASGPTGYAGTHAFQIIAGALPSGLTMSSSGLITGTTCDATGSAWTAGFRVTLNSAPSTTHDFTGTNAFSSGINNAGGGGGSRCTVVVSGTTPTGTVGTAYSADIDATGTVGAITFTLSGSLPPGLTLNTATGVISGTPTTAGTYGFSLIVADAGGRNGVGTFSITINPVAVALNLTPATLPDGQTTTAYAQTIGSSNGTAPFSFNVSAGTLPTGLTLAAGGALSGTPTAAGTYNFTVQGTDAASNTGTRAYTVTIAGSDTLALSPTTLPNGARSAAYSEAITAAGGTAPYAFSITGGALPAGLSLSSTGTLSGTPTATGTFNFTVRAQDANGNFGTRAHALVITGASIALTPTTLPGTTNGNSYGQTITASGGTGPYTFSVTAGTLPNGMTLAANGTFFGTVSSPAGTYNFTFTATDAFGDTGSQAYTFTLAPATLILSPSTLPNGTNGTAYVGGFSTSDGLAPYTYTLESGTLPTGLALSSTGALTGTPNVAAGTFNFSVRSTDANGDTVVGAYALTIQPATLSIDPAALSNARNGQAYGTNFSVIGGTAPVTFTLASGALPNGITLASTGELAGTPSATTSVYNFSILATDANGDTVTQPYSLVVDPAIMGFSPGVLLPAMNGVAYSQALTVTGTGTAPYTYAVTAGALPTGMSLSATGVLAGTPSVAAGMFNFDITVTDANGDTATQAYALQVDAATLTLDPATLPDGANSAPYSATVTASGGMAPYAFSISAGTFPIGLVLAGDGTITGTPTAAGTYNFTVQANDANGDIGARAYTVNIAAATITVAPASLPGGTNSTPYTASFSATGGTAPYTYTVSAGALPTTILLAGDTLSGTPTTAGTYNFEIKATDANGDAGTRLYSVTVAAATIAITPASLPGATNGVGYSEALDALGGTAPYTFAVTAGALPSGITLSPTGTLSGTPGTAAGTFNVTIAATDANGDTASQAYALVVGSASITVNPATLPGGTNSSAYSATFTATGGTAPYTYVVNAGALPAGLTLAGGTLTGTPMAAGTFNFTIQATDPNGDTGTRAYSLSIASATIAITPATLPDATNGAAYSQSLAASGGTAPYTFALDAGALPSGMTLSATGTLSGTPSVAAGTFNFSVIATDANGDTVTRAYSLVVDPATVTVNPASLAGATNGVAYSATFTATGGSAPYTYSLVAGALPAGLTLAGDTLAGTPTTAGTFNFTIQATDANGDTGTRAYSVTTASATITIAPASLPGATNGAPYSQALSASGGTAPYTYAITAGALPAGIALSGGALAGTPSVAAGTFNVSVTATDANGDTATQAYSLVVASATVDVTPASLPNGTNSSAYTASFAATGGTAPYTYALAGGTLPSGLVFAGDTLSGTPTAAGTFNFSMQAIDANGDTGTRAYAVTIASATIVIAPGTLPNATNGATYNQALTASGGTAPYTFAVTAGAMPAGLALSTGGTLSGTPNGVAGTFNFTIEATDANGDTATHAYSLVLGSATVDVTPAALPNGTNSNAYTASFAATGGTAPYTYTLVAGALPAGLAFAGDTLSGTPTAAGNFNFTMQATDANGDTGTRAYAVTIASASIAVTPATLPGGTNGASYMQAVSATGGTAPYAFAVTAGALPAGLTLAGGTVSGTPSCAAGTFHFTIEATDANGDIGTHAYSIAVAAATIDVAPATLPDGTNGSAYAQSVNASGGTGPYTYAIASGALPAGMTLSASGALSGTPHAAGTFDFTVEATDANGDTGTHAYALAIAGGDLLTVAPDAIAGATAGDAYTQAFAATGGAGPYTFAITAGELPEGLALAADGTLSGTPASAGTFDFTVTATDADGNFGTHAYALAVAEAIVLDIAPGTLEAGHADASYTQAFEATGGTGPYTFSIAAGTLPAGMTLASDGTLSGTPTTAGTYHFTVQGEDALGHQGQHAYELVIGAALRGDPTRDPGVIDLVNDQIAATRRMGELQMSHAFRRLAAPQAPCTVAAGESSDKCAHRVEAWATGTRETNFASGTAVTNAFTLGADMALGRVRLGAALGTGWDLIERASGYRGDADGITWMLYGRVALGETFGIAAVAGRTDVDLDSRRALGGGAAVVGQRDGENRFAGVELTGQWNIGDGGLVPYVRYERSDLRLGTSMEGGNGPLALQYGAIKTRQSAVVAGAEAFYGIRYDWGMLTPKVRVEYRERRGDAVGQAMWYRDTPNTPYILGVRGLDDSSALATFGLEAAFGGVKVTLEYGTAGSTDDWFDGQAVRLEFRAEF